MFYSNYQLPSTNYQLPILTSHTSHKQQQSAVLEHDGRHLFEKIHKRLYLLHVLISTTAWSDWKKM
ncbi:MAG: hypothetical protein AAF757_22650 [Cyanobacteria bacterium P01_D01_bin.116]